MILHESFAQIALLPGPCRPRLEGFIARTLAISRAGQPNGVAGWIRSAPAGYSARLTVLHCYTSKRNTKIPVLRRSLKHIQRLLRHQCSHTIVIRACTAAKMAHIPTWRIMRIGFGQKLRGRLADNAQRHCCRIVCLAGDSCRRTRRHGLLLSLGANVPRPEDDTLPSDKLWCGRLDQSVFRAFATAAMCRILASGICDRPEAPSPKP